MNGETSVERQRRNEDLLLVLHFFSCYRGTDSREKFFEDIDSFLALQLQAYPLLIFTYPIAGASAEENIVWNKEALGREYNIDEILNAVSGHSQSDFYRFEFGMGPRYVGIFKADRALDKDLIKYFGRVVENVFEKVIMAQDLIDLNVLIHLDDVTGLFNQRKMLKDLDYCIDRYEQYGENFVVLFIDIDHFKDVNDGHGHLIGTKLLTELGTVLKSVLRESDWVYRYGGDEFVMIVPNSSAVEARIIGERLLKTIKGHEFLKRDNSVFKLSVSIGISTYPNDAKTRKEVLEMADQMMYKAKVSGRGRVCMAADFFRK